MSEIIQIAHNAVVAKLINASPEVKARVGDVLSYIVEGIEFMNAGSWNGRSSFFSHTKNTFPAGFASLVYGDLTRLGHKVQFVRSPLPAPLGPENPIVDEFGNDDPRYDYQMQALRQVERHGRGIIKVATGGGKSKIAKLITMRYRRPTLFLTTRGVLMYQMADAVKKAGLNVGFLGDGEWTPVRGFNAGMVQTLVSNVREINLNVEMRSQIGANIRKGLEVPRTEVIAEVQAKIDKQNLVRAKTIKLLELFEVVIGEEAHEAGGNSYYEILKHCRNAHIRIALTATPFMRSDTEDNMRLMAAFGPKLIDVSEKMLIDREILARPQFKFVHSQPHPKLRKTSPWQRAYQLGYIENTFMINDIVRDAKMAASLGLPVLTLVQRKKHGEILKDVMRSQGLRAAYIQGADDQVDRKRALRDLSAGKLQVLIGTTILDVGVDVPAIGLLQLAGGGKAEVGTRQRIGRGLRAKKQGPNVCLIADYSTSPNTHLQDHAKQRRAIIESTEGFRENILPPGKDFDWHLFKERAAA